MTLSEEEQRKEAVRLAREAAVHNLANAREADMAAARFLWDKHRAALGGYSSVSGAPLPTWEEMLTANPLAANAHLVMAVEARGYFFAEGQTAKASP